MFFEQPLSTALQPVYRLLIRTAWLLALGVLLAVLFGVLMARHMVVPIRALQFGAQQLETSDFGHRIDVRTGDEIEDLANRRLRVGRNLHKIQTRFLGKAHRLVCLDNAQILPFGINQLDARYADFAIGARPILGRGIGFERSANGRILLNR